MIAALLKYNPEQVQTVEMIRLDGQRPMIELFGFHQAAGLMQRQSFGEQRGNNRGAWGGKLACA